MASGSAPQRRANVIGLGLIGGSVGFALRERGWLVSGDDADPAVCSRAVELGAVDRSGIDPEDDVRGHPRARPG